RWKGVPFVAAPPSSAPATTSLRGGQRAFLAALGFYVMFQLLMPLRHFLYPGYVSWTEDGHRFSWHMKLRGKQSAMAIIVRMPNTGATFAIDPRQDLTDRQLRK